MSNSTVNYGLPDKFIGAGYIVSSTAILIVYLPCLKVIGFDKSMCEKSCLRIMFHLGISDVLSLIGNIILGFWAMTGYAYTVPYWLNLWVVSLCCELGYRTYVVLINVLAFNRCVVFCLSPAWNGKIFSPRNTSLWLALSWGQAWVYTIMSLSGKAAMIYIAPLFVWYYDFGAPLLKLKMRMDWWSCFLNQGCVVVWYILIARELHKASQQTGDTRTRNSERALLKQATILCLVLIAMDQYWHNIVDLLCPRMGLYCYPLGNFLVIVNNGCNPLVYMTLNKTISNKVLVSVGLKKHVAPSSRPSPTPKTSKRIEQIDNTKF